MSTIKLNYFLSGPGQDQARAMTPGPKWILVIVVKEKKFHINVSHVHIGVSRGQGF